MDRLRELFEELGFSSASTFIASGNVLFSTAKRDTSKLEREIETHLEKSLGYRVDTFVRTHAEMAAVAASRLFGSAQDDPSVTINVTFCKEPPAPEMARRLEAIRTDVDEFRVSGREWFWLCRIRMSESTVWNLPAAKALKLPSGTMRNLNTVEKLAALSAPK
jgi:uncharacterized protein (DUF1697 family)